METTTDIHMLEALDFDFAPSKTFDLPAAYAVLVSAFARTRLPQLQTDAVANENE